MAVLAASAARARPLRLAGLSWWLSGPRVALALAVDVRPAGHAGALRLTVVTARAAAEYAAAEAEALANL